MRINPHDEPDVIDHLKVIKVDAYRRRVVRALRRRAESGGLLDLVVMHDGDPGYGRCCRREPWPVTLKQLVTASGVKTMVVRL